MFALTSSLTKNRNRLHRGEGTRLKNTKNVEVNGILFQKHFVSLHSQRCCQALRTLS